MQFFVGTSGLLVLREGKNLSSKKEGSFAIKEETHGNASFSVTGGKKKKKNVKISFLVFPHAHLLPDCEGGLF